MFQALILVCAATLNGGPTDPCILLTSEVLNPTKEACEARLDQMLEEIESDQIYLYYLSMQLGRPEHMAHKTKCVSKLMV